MIHFRSGDTPPNWCELTHFSVEAPSVAESIIHTRLAPCERILMTRGRCSVSAGAQSMVLRQGQFFDLTSEISEWMLTAATDDAEYLRLAGTWGNSIAGCGTWSLANENNPSDPGDLVTYPKHTSMDSHYHDYDEYWFILDGAATVIVSGQALDVSTGDCIAIGAGHHHDMPQVHQPMRGAFFETTLIGQKRLGHLWNHTHGPAIPTPGRL